MYINGASVISAQLSFQQPEKKLRLEPLAGEQSRAAEPDYSSLIDPKLSRRMSRVIRMGVVTAMDALQQASVQQPDAIITGTAYGCLDDTGIFLKRLVENKEEMLTPTAFIQSTHNTVGAQIALLLKCHAYNNTYVQQSLSFEQSLLDAQLWLAENQGSTVLVGASDELTRYSYDILKRFGLFRQQPAGEGAAYFVMQSEKKANSWARIDALEIVYEPDEKWLRDKYAEWHPDVVVAGGLPVAHEFTIPVVRYETYSATYPTASAFAVWLAAYWLKFGAPLWDEQVPETPERILVHDVNKEGYHTLIALSRC